MTANDVDALLEALRVSFLYEFIDDGKAKARPLLEAALAKAEEKGYQRQKRV